MSHLIVPTVSVRLQVIGDALHRLIQFFEQSVGGADPNYEPVTGILADLRNLHATLGATAAKIDQLRHSGGAKASL